jgi:hypothetical protein
MVGMARRGVNYEFIDISIGRGVTVRYLVGRTACRDTADVRPRARTYDQCAAGKPYFHQTSYSSCFPYFRVVLVELRLIEGFPQIWSTQIFQSFRRRLSIQVSFNSHNAHCYFPYIACLFCIPSKHAYFTTLTVYTYCI